MVRFRGRGGGGWEGLEAEGRRESRRLRGEGGRVSLGLRREREGGTSGVVQNLAGLGEGYFVGWVEMVRFESRGAEGGLFRPGTGEERKDASTKSVRRASQREKETKKKSVRAHQTPLIVLENIPAPSCGIGLRSRGRVDSTERVKGVSCFGSKVERTRV